jgi:hypothetical protein
MRSHVNVNVNVNVHVNVHVSVHVHVKVKVKVNVLSLGLSNATEEQQVYSAIWDTPMLQETVDVSSVRTCCLPWRALGPCMAHCTAHSGHGQGGWRGHTVCQVPEGRHDGHSVPAPTRRGHNILQRGVVIETPR